MWTYGHQYEAIKSNNTAPLKRLAALPPGRHKSSTRLLEGRRPRTSPLLYITYPHVDKPQFNLINRMQPEIVSFLMNCSQVLAIDQGIEINKTKQVGKLNNVRHNRYSKYT